MSTALVVTSINPPNEAMREMAAGCRRHGWDFVLAGDSKSPPEFELEGCRFLSLEEQQAGTHSLGRIAPQRSYTRKNIAYLEAIAAGAEVIVETDDDNRPRPEFWHERRRVLRCSSVASGGWVNVYRYFTDGFIYPRGLPLPHARDVVPSLGPVSEEECPIQQGLADSDPDVDAIYRMLYPLPFEFGDDPGPVLLKAGTWCPFNSQNTTHFRDVFPLLYLPACCNFRMTDIWRSFVAQRILEARGHGVLFHGATVRQERNDHDLHDDFIDEVPGYLNNDRIRSELRGLSLSPESGMRGMLEACYGLLVSRGWVGADERPLLAAWCDDLESLGVM